MPADPDAPTERMANFDPDTGAPTRRTVTLLVLSVAIGAALVGTALTIGVARLVAVPASADLATKRDVHDSVANVSVRLDRIEQRLDDIRDELARERK